jgi:YaiO family outer membrane protein
MKYLNVALLLMMSFTVPAYHVSERTPASEIKKNPIEDLFKKALELRERGDFEGALVLLNEAEAIDPANLDVTFYTGLTLYDLGKFDEAQVKLRTLLIKAPLYVDAKIFLGRTLIALGKLPESEKYLREAIAQSPDYMEGYDALASNLLAQKKTEEAIFILDLGLTKKPDDATLLVKKAKIYFVTKDYKKSADVAQILTGITDLYGRYEGHVLLGKIAFEENPMKINLATPDLQEAIDLEPVESEAYLVLTDVYVSMWKFKEAREVLEAALDAVRNREEIEKKQADVAAIEKGVLNFSVNATFSQWDMKDGSKPWRDFYLDAVWRIDPYKTLVFGAERFGRGGMHDEALRIEYIQQVNKWVYLYASAKVTIDPDFREKTAFKLGGNYVTNPLAVGPTVWVAEAETRNYECDRIYFVTGGVDQHFGDSVVINARVFKVLSGTEDFNAWSVKSTWSLTPKFDISANYGTMTEDISGRPARGTSKGVGAQYRINDRVSVTGNYQRVDNEMYRANQVTVGVKVKLGPSRPAARATPARTFQAPEPKKKKRFFFF